MESVSGNKSSGIRPLSAGDAQPATTTATRAGRDPSGKPLSDKDVWGGIKTPEGLPVDTSDGISVGEGQALASLAMQSAKEFVQRLSADSENGTAVKYRWEEPFEGIGTAFVEFTALNDNLLIDSGVQVNQEAIAKYLKDYLADDGKQNKQPVIGKMTLTGKINEADEIEGLKGELSLANLPKFSADKLGEFQKNIDSVLEQLPVGSAITEEIKKQVADQLKSKLSNTSRNAVNLFRELAQESRVLTFDIGSEKSLTKGHVKAGLSALGIQVENLADEAASGYPRIDGATDITLDKEDKDTVDLGTLKAYTTENLLINVDGEKPKLFRIEADGSRTEMNDIFGYLIYIPFLLGQLRGGRGSLIG